MDKESSEKKGFFATALSAIKGFVTKEPASNAKENDVVEKTRQDLSEKMKYLENQIKSGITGDQLAMAKYALYTTQKQYENIRAENPETTQKQFRTQLDFSNQLKSVLSDNLHLKFHGAKDIWAAEDIIKSGGIMSGKDAFGFQVSHDDAGVFSVTDKNMVDLTVSAYAGLSNTTYPAGCIFVMLPNGGVDDGLSKTMKMQNVDFKENPNQLYAIITTDENVDRIKQCCAESGMRNVPVETYDSILPMIERDSATLDNCAKNSNIDLSSSNDVMSSLGRDLQQPSLENYFVRAETFCGLENDGPVQSFEKCISDIQRDSKLAKDVLDGKSLEICFGEYAVAECAITEDNKLAIKYTDSDRVDFAEFEQETLKDIVDYRANNEMSAGIEEVSKAVPTKDDGELGL